MIADLNPVIKRLFGGRKTVVGRVVGEKGGVDRRWKIKPFVREQKRTPKRIF